VLDWSDLSTTRDTLWLDYLAIALVHHLRHHLVRINSRGIFYCEQFGYSPGLGLLLCFDLDTQYNLA
jgi:hypothetical protein